MAITMEEEKEVKEVVQEKKDNKDLKKKFEAMRLRDREMVKGIFHFYEVPGGTMGFSYSCYAEDPVENFDLKDGEMYTIPLGVARHLNSNCWYPVHKHAVDDKGFTSVRIGQKIKRCGFQSLEFIDPEDIGSFEESKILSVEKV